MHPQRQLVATTVRDYIKKLRRNSEAPGLSMPEPGVPRPITVGYLCPLTGIHLILSSRNGHPSLATTTLISRYDIQGVQFMSITGTSITKNITKVNTKERGNIGIRGTFYECITL